MVPLKPLFLVLLVGTAVALSACEATNRGGEVADRRFEVQPVYSSEEGAMVVRADTATGALQSASLVGGRNWKPLGEPAVAEGTPGRFGFNFAQANSIPLTFIRVDKDTGDVWRMAYPRDDNWVAFRNEGDEQTQASAPEPRTTAPPRARAAVLRPEAAKAEPTAQRRPGTAPEDVGAYVEGFESENLPAEMRAWAVEQLGNVPGPDAIPPLLAALELDDPSIVRSAIRALAKHQDPRVRPALEKMTEHPTAEIARVAKATLATLP